MYKTIVVGTDGSDSSLLAVRRAAGIASAFGAKLVLASAYYESDADAMSSPRGDSKAVIGDASADETLSSAVAVAQEEGVDNVSTQMRPGSPVEALMAIVTDVEGDLLVVGNRGINSLTGRLLGSVPADLARQSNCDTMIVHTVD